MMELKFIQLLLLVIVIVYSYDVQINKKLKINHIFTLNKFTILSTHEFYYIYAPTNMIIINIYIFFNYLKLLLIES